MTRTDILQDFPSDTANLAEIERRAHEMRALAVAEGAAGLARAVARLFGHSGGGKPTEAAL